MTNQEINEAVARKLGYGTPTGNALPNYCTSIAAAWEIASHCAKFSVFKEPDNYQWYCDMNKQKVIKGDTAPMAICLAFLKLP